MEAFLVCMQDRSCTAYIDSLKTLERMSQRSDVLRYVQYQHLLPLFEIIKWDVYTWCRRRLCSLKEVCVGSILQLFLCAVHLLWPNHRLNPVL